MMKNITLSADERLIEAARRKAQRKNTTLNAEFRRWLGDYADGKQLAEKAMRAFEELEGEIKTNGRKFTRDEMNER